MELIDNAMNELNKARDYARTHGEGEWYNLLNAILSEINARIN